MLIEYIDRIAYYLKRAACYDDTTLGAIAKALISANEDELQTMEVRAGDLVCQRQMISECLLEDRVQDGRGEGEEGAGGGRERARSGSCARTRCCTGEERGTVGRDERCTMNMEQE